MIKADQLERAIELREQLKNIETFLSGYQGAEGWRGSVTLSFGSYFFKIDGDLKTELEPVIQKQRNACLAEMAELGVQF